MTQVEFIDTSTRDGDQSLWSATGLATADVLAVAPVIERVGYHALDFTASTFIGISVRFHREDPWRRIRLVSAATPSLPLPPTPVGNSTEVFSPTFDFQSGLTSER